MRISIVIWLVLSPMLYAGHGLVQVTIPLEVYPDERVRSGVWVDVYLVHEGRDCCVFKKIKLERLSGNEENSKEVSATLLVSEEAREMLLAFKRGIQKGKILGPFSLRSWQNPQNDWIWKRRKKVTPLRDAQFLILTR